MITASTIYTGAAFLATVVSFIWVDGLAAIWKVLWLVALLATGLTMMGSLFLDLLVMRAL